MLSSANGRHRRPRQTPAAVVTVAATGAGIALPLLGTGVGAAHAAGDSTWEKVAICETGGQWDHHSHNGFYGGLNITLTDWVLYGGLQYADRPDHATRAAQIIVAEKILATLGPDAWRDCEIGTGLLDDETPAADDGASAGDEHGGQGKSDGSGETGNTGKNGRYQGGTDDRGDDQDAASDGGASSTDPADTSTDPSDASTSPEPTDTSGATGTPDGTGTTPADPATTTPTDPADSTDPADTSAPPSADDTGTPAAPADPATGGGRHARPYSPADEALAAVDRATRTVTSAVTEGAAADADKGGKTDTASHKAPSTYTVDSGDSLSGIAAAQDVPGGWQHLYDANQQLIGDDPNLIKPGQILELG